MFFRELLFQAFCKFVISGCVLEYENVRYYEEILEYENLSFIMVIGKILELEWQNFNSIEDIDVNVYEVEELYEVLDGQL